MARSPTVERIKDLEVYDKAGNFIGYVLRCNVSQTPPLEEPVPFGVNEREIWMEEIVRRAETEGWSHVQRKNVITRAAQEASLAALIRPDDLIFDAMLATRTPVRRHFHRLREVRDQSWEREPDFLQLILIGPSRVLVDLMRRQSHPHEQMYTASADAYLAYLHQLFSDK